MNEASNQLAQIAKSIVTRFDETNVCRDRALTDSRQIIRSSANSIRAAHRGDFELAAESRVHAAQMLGRLLEQLDAHPSIRQAGYVQDAMKEFAEASITLAILRGSPLPSPDSLGVEDAPYLNGLAEAASELRRDALDALRRGDLPVAANIVDAMDEIYGVLVTIDYPDAITGGLRRTTDALRAVLERTRGDVTVAHVQERLRIALNSSSKLDGDQVAWIAPQIDEDAPPS